MVESLSANKPPMRTRPLKAFAIYDAQGDQIQYEDFRKQLATLERSNLISVRDLSSIEAGKELELEIDKIFRESDIFLLIISSSFFASNQCFEFLNKALQMSENNERKAIVINLKSCETEAHIPRHIEILPSARIPVPQDGSRDLILRDIATRIREISIEMIAENFKKRIKILEHSLESVEELKSLKNLAFLYSEVGKIYKLSLNEEGSNDWLTRAVETYERITSIEPENPENYDQAGSIYEKLDQPEKALTSYDQGLEVLPYDNKLLEKSGNLQEKMGRFDEALKRYEAILEILPESYVTWYERGMTLNQLGRKKEAIQSFRKALSINPRYRLAKYQQRLVYSTL